MAVLLSPVAGVAGQFFDNNGNPLVGGKLYAYVAGTTTPQASYTSAAGGTAHANPIVLDAGGRVPGGEIWLTDGLQYKFVLKTSTDTLIGTYDNVMGINSNFVNFTNQQEIQTATAGQKVFTLATVTYSPGTNSLSIFVNGVNQYGPGATYAYLETDSTTITFLTGLSVGASVKFTTSQLNSGASAVTAAAISYTPAGTGAVPTTVQAKLRESVSVLDFGAVGDGVADDTAAFNLAATALQSYQSLHIPAGNYVADLNAILFRGKTHIDIYGDGEATRIAPTNQGVSPSKVDYHTTFAIDECSFVTVRDMVIESKGESYGNTDAYGGLASGDPRTNAIINYGGSAVVVTRSDHVTLKNITSRLCGSVGVFYFSSCEEVVVENCFANAGSLGYAGFAADNWAASTVKPKRTYKFIDCRTGKETYTYCCKGAIVLEGDQITGRLLNVEVVGGVFQDCVIGGTSPLIAGAAITAAETRLLVSGVVTKNCYMGVYWVKRGGAVDFSWLSVTGCTFYNNGVTGISYLVGSATGGTDISITGNKIVSAATSVWAALASPTYDAVKYSAGITGGGYVQGTMDITGNDISGGQYGLYATDNNHWNVSGNNISGSLGAVAMWGGGILRANANTFTTTDPTVSTVYMTTANKAATASYASYFAVTNNIINCAADTTSDYAINLAGNSALWGTTHVKGNTVLNGLINVGIGSATVYNVDPIVINAVAKVTAVGLAGANTNVGIQMPKDWVYSQFVTLINSVGTSYTIATLTNNSGGTRGLVQCLILTDVRSVFPVGSQVFLMA